SRWGWLRVQVSIIEALTVRRILPEHADLALKPENRSPDIGFTQQNCGITDELTRGETIRTIQNQIVSTENIQRIITGQLLFMQLHSDKGVQFGNGFSSRNSLGLTDIGLSMNHLTL